MPPHSEIGFAALMRSREVSSCLSRLRMLALGALLAGLVVLGGCGDDDFENNPRPPSPIELTAAIDPRSVTIAPAEFGAGLVTITISNQTKESINLVLDGPTPAESGDIPPSGTGTIRASLDEGEYQATAGSPVEIKPDTITVGPERETSQNDLLLP